MQLDDGLWVAVVSCLFSADKWWRAAIDATLYVIRDRHKKWTKEHLVARAQLNRQYVALYEAVLDNPYLVSQVEKVVVIFFFFTFV